MELIGATLDGRYRLVDCLSMGSHASLYRSVQLSIDRAVALKVEREDPECVRAMPSRLRREIGILAALNHPNIVSVLDGGETEAGQSYLVMELLRGATLEAELERVVRFDARHACELAIQLCRALTAAHSLGIAHRDLQLSNIMVLDDSAVRDQVKVVGFGLAQSFARDAEDAAVEVGRDLYCLGRVLCKLLGMPPTHTLPASVPPPLARVVSMLFADRPERETSAESVHDQLQAFLDHNGRHNGRPEQAEPVTLVDEDAETLTVVPLAEQPTLHTFPDRRVLPPTPLYAQRMPSLPGQVRRR